MQLPLQIATRNVQLSAAEEAMIREAATKLESFAPRILRCRVLVEVPNRRHRTGSRYNVRIDLHIPEGEIVIQRQPAPTLRTSVQDAFKAAARRLQDQVRRQRGDIKLPRHAPHGLVTRLIPWEGYGFLTTPDGREIYFDRHSVLHDAFDSLVEGAEVRFVEELGEHGPQASTVAVRRRP